MITSTLCSCRCCGRVALSVSPDQHWPVVKQYLTTLSHTLLEAQEQETAEADAVTALASLSMVTAKMG